MKAMTTTVTYAVKTPTFVKITAFALISLSLFFLFNRFSSTYPLLIFSSTATLTPSLPPPTETTPSQSQSQSQSQSPPPPSPPPPPPPVDMVIRMGIVDETGAMSLDFQVGEIADDESVSLVDVSGSGRDEVKQKSDDVSDTDRFNKVGKYNACDESMTQYIPCFNDNLDQYERHCPGEGKALDCVLPRPVGYQTKIPWPKSRDQVWFSNVPHTRLVEDKGHQNLISIKEDKFVFSGGGRAEKYLNQISKMVPDIAFGQKTRVALDIDCGVADFGAFLMQRNVTTLSIAPKDVHENQIQFALERGVPAMVATFAMHRLLYPSQAFDLIHCSRCRVNWNRDDGILLLEANRILRAGGYFVWALDPAHKPEENLQERWREMEDLTTRICWELVKKDGFIAIWRKPLNNSCYLNRDSGVKPPLCDSNNDPDKVWYVGLEACITQLPESGYGGNVTTWPARLHHPPDRLQSIEMDAYISRKEIFKAESKFLSETIAGYVGAFRWRDFKLRNVMDMRAGYGGFAAALYDIQIDCWVMNVVPVSESNTLPVIYDRGLVGVRHDWCEPFDTYPRTYDLLHANGLFSVEKKRHRCNISTIMLEMDRMLRPDGRVYIRDRVSVIGEVQEIASALGWVAAARETAEGPHSSWRILICEKRM